MKKILSNWSMLVSAPGLAVCWHWYSYWHSDTGSDTDLALIQTLALNTGTDTLVHSGSIGLTYAKVMQGFSVEGNRLSPIKHLNLPKAKTVQTVQMAQNTQNSPELDALYAIGQLVSLNWKLSSSSFSLIEFRLVVLGLEVVGLRIR